MKKLTFALCVLLSSNTVVYASETVHKGLKGDAEAGKAKTVTCAACHGADGNSPAPMFPKLAGQHADYIVKQLQDFKSGMRQGPTMAPMVAPLSEQDMHDLAAYYTEQKVTVSEIADLNAVALGEKIYRGGNKESKLMACVACHGPQGLGNAAAHYPALSGQHADYTKKQLENFKAGVRDNQTIYTSRFLLMRDIAAKMSDEEIQSVADYISGLH